MTEPRPPDERDFLAYEPHRQSDPEYNGFRLAVRRKLAAWIEPVRAAATTRSVPLKAWTGLHHPYVHNSHRVREQRAYLCRSDRERKALARHFGEDLGKDAETHYIQTVLEVALDHEGLDAALRIHPHAWWDGEHLRRRVSDVEGMEAFRGLLNDLPEGFLLLLHDWRKEYRCGGALTRSDLEEFFSAYTPGNHWLHVRRRLSKQEALAMAAEVPAWAASSLLSLLDLYRFVLWVP